MEITYKGLFGTQAISTPLDLIDVPLDVDNALPPRMRLYPQLHYGDTAVLWLNVTDYTKPTPRGQVPPVGATFTLHSGGLREANHWGRGVHTMRSQTSHGETIELTYRIDVINPADLAGGGGGRGI
jgi:hypothetical protein